LKANLRHIFIDEQWVAEQYLQMEKTKSWKDFDTDNDMGVLTLEPKLLLVAESLGVSSETLPPITVNDSEQVQDKAL
jgi:hypothetical protein